MKVVVDTNIIFSALIRTNSTIGEIIINTENIRFFTSDYMHVELRNHHSKLKKASGLTDEDIAIVQYKLFKNISSITFDIVPEQCWSAAEQLVAGIAMDDLPFVALALYLDAYLWTGDKILYHGLKTKGFEKVVSTQELRYFIDEFS